MPKSRQFISVRAFNFSAFDRLSVMLTYFVFFSTPSWFSRPLMHEFHHQNAPFPPFGWLRWCLCMNVRLMAPSSPHSPPMRSHVRYWSAHAAPEQSGKAPHHLPVSSFHMFQGSTYERMSLGRLYFL